MTGSQRLRILHLLAPAPQGGLERVVQALAIGHQRRGHAVAVGAVLTSSSELPPFLEDVRRAGTTVIPIVVRDRAYLQEMRIVHDVCKSHAPDIVHTHGYRSDLVDAWAARKSPARLVSTIHGFTHADWKNALYQVIQRIGARRFDAVAAVSRGIAARLIRYGTPPDKVHVISNAYPGDQDILDASRARSYLGVDHAAVRLGWVGRVVPDKGLDVLIEALAEIADVDWRLSVIGDGPALTQNRSRARSLGIDDRIDWHGVISEAGRVMRAFDLYVLSSRTEGTPIVLFEAMAAGVPIIACSVGGVPDVVSEQEARLVPAENAPLLAEAIRTALVDTHGRTSRAMAASRRLSDFGLNPWLDKYEDLYRSLCRA